MMRMMRPMVVATLLTITAMGPADAQGQRADWRTTAAALKGQVGQTFTYVCPPGGVIGASVWGSNPYTTDSAICPAAVHAGKITSGKGGAVTIQIQPGAASYQGSARNGVGSQRWAAYDSSFSFEIDQSLEARPGERIASWTTNAKEHDGAAGQSFTYVCSKGGTLGASVWGTDLYTTDSAICPAAVHAAKITPDEGGTVTILIRRGAASYPGSARNGVGSQRWGAYEWSFSFK